MRTPWHRLPLDFDADGLYKLPEGIENQLLQFRIALYHLELYYIGPNFLLQWAVERIVDELGFFLNFRSGLASAYRTMYPP